MGAKFRNVYKGLYNWALFSGWVSAGFAGVAAFTLALRFLGVEGLVSGLAPGY